MSGTDQQDTKEKVFRPTRLNQLKLKLTKQDDLALYRMNQCRKKFRLKMLQRLLKHGGKYDEKYIDNLKKSMGL